MGDHEAVDHNAKACEGVSMGVQNKPCVASSRVKDNISCRNSCFSSSLVCRDLLFTGLGMPCRTIRNLPMETPI